MKQIPQLEVHYHLKDGLHSMDALVRNRCEAEFLGAVSYITKTLGVELRFEATFPTEGGFRDLWRVLIDKENQPWVTAILMPLVLLILNQTVTIWNAPAKPSPELEKQQLEINRLTIEHWKLENHRSALEVQKLEREIVKTPETAQVPGLVSASPPVRPPPLWGASAPSAPNAGNATTVEGGATAIGHQKPPLQTDSNVITRRSNFYKQLIDYERVTAVGFRWIADDRSTSEETTVERSRFGEFIIRIDTLEPEVSVALIEIVSPVITEGDMKWKGRRNGETISFAMGDGVFKKQVFQGAVSFQHGDSIRCVLESERKLDEVGNVKVTGYRVKTVLDKIDGSGEVHETLQGRKKRFADKQPSDGQSDLFGHVA